MKTFSIGGQEYSVAKKGMAQAKQVAGITRWLSRYGAPTLRKLADTGTEGASGFEVLITFLGELDENALVSLFQAIFGCPREAAEAEFDIAMMADGLIAAYEDVPSLRSLADRFFSSGPSTSTEDSNSTPSEEPTAG